MTTNFDDIRPYTDAEIPEAMNRIAETKYLPDIVNFIFPEKKPDEIQALLRSFNTIHDFQVKIMHLFNKQVIKKTMTQFSCCGFENLDPKKCYLFVSNHRDIVLDSSLLQSVFVDNGFRTTEITFGENLMSSQLVVDIGRSNKMFKVARAGTTREFYNHSLHLSEYIRHTLTQKRESIWIAQRNGRTKNGNDATDQGIIKMFCMCKTQNLVESLNELNIVPISVSYQLEPCDMFKTKELYQSRESAKYVKQKDEDFISILTGITQQKGNVHISLCKPIEREEYSAFQNELPNIFYKKVALLIDERIYQNYKLWNTNYIAHDIRSETSKYANHYTAEEKGSFVQRFHQIINQIDGDKEVIASIFLGIYANPVDNGDKRV